MTAILNSRIYVADDEPVNIALLEAVLGRAGYTSITAFPDGEALLAETAEREPDLILLDLRMPVLDGMTVLKRLPETVPAGRYLPVLVLTADATRASRDQALSSGAHDYLTKPFDPAEVLLRVGNLLETRRLHEDLRRRNEDLTDQIDATTQTLAHREREWAQQAAALSQLEVRETAEATAQAVCDELSRMNGLTSVLIMAIDGAGHAVPLARDDSVDVRVRVNSPLPPELKVGWADRVGAGPWVGPYMGDPGSSLRRVAASPLTAMAIVPLRTGTAMLGAIVVCTEVSDGIPFLAARLPTLESFGAVASALLAPAMLSRQRRREVRGDLKTVLAEAAFNAVFQPILDLSSGLTVGHEALTRFRDGTRPDQRFADAEAVGLGLELESACLSAAIEAARDLPDRGWLSVNVSPALLLERRLLQQCLRAHVGPVVLEVTEHVAIEDYAAISEAVTSIGADVRMAVDDAGAGFASFRHILELRPDYVKLDIGLVREIDHDDVRQALVAGIVYFADKSGCRLIAEGIETPGERDQLRSLGVDFGQGFLLGRPAPASSPARRAPEPTAPSPTGATRTDRFNGVITAPR